ncbi:MAG: metallophosphoesterase [Nitrospiraceae bacterium]|nr:MAG: metallophosphoesterase [Nitrospiraceae bacterium]
MIIFLSFVTIYGLGNLYVFFKVSNVLNAGLAGDICTGLFILLMASSPVLVHMYSLRGSERPTRILSLTGYMWMAFVVIFSPAAALLDSYNFLAQQTGLLSGRAFNSITIPRSYTFFIPAFFSVTFSIYGYFEAKRLKIEKLTVKTSRLPAGTDRITLAQVSDLHLGIIAGDRTLNKVIREIGNARPDLIVSTGDLLDGAVTHIDYMAQRLKDMSAPLGKFAVIGNHEFYGGLKHAVRFIQDAGFILLRNRGVNVNGTINIAGVDDMGDMDEGLRENIKSAPEREMLAGLSPGIFTILLKHRSVVDRNSLGLFDLQLSGHTHKGQIFPINLLTWFIFEHHAGFRDLGKGSALYVSRGAGTAGPPVRFLSPPELTIIEIVNEGIFK